MLFEFEASLLNSLVYSFSFFFPYGKNYDLIQAYSKDRNAKQVI